MSADRLAGARLVRCGESALARELASLDEAREAIVPGTAWWGYLARPDSIRFLHRSGEEWRRLLGDPDLVEARVFHRGADLHWLDGRGVVLEDVPPAASDREVAGAQTIGGDGWWVRERRSRLWGKHLEGTEVWYEEVIPDPLRYEGIDAGPPQLYVFLCYREYVRGGAVRFVRFLGLEGGKR